MNNWQPIATAPKDGTVVDLWVNGIGRFTNCVYRDDDDWWWYWTDNLATGLWCPLALVPSHWLPLPAPPEVQK